MGEAGENDAAAIRRHFTQSAIPVCTFSVMVRCRRNSGAASMADPKMTVACGYDAIADVYLTRYGTSAVRDRWLRRLLELLPPRARVLDLGCGAGLPVAKELSAHGVAV